MLKNIYVVTFHTYWEHYNAKPTKTEYESKEEALKDANDYESRWFMEDGYYATVHTEKRVVITLEEHLKSIERRRARLEFNYKKDAYAYGIYTFWDGSRKVFFITKDEHASYIYFLEKGKAIGYRLAETIDYFRSIAYPYQSLFRGTGMWCMDDGEEMTILGGQIFSLPSCCHKIDTIKLERNINNLM